MLTIGSMMVSRLNFICPGWSTPSGRTRRHISCSCRKHRRQLSVVRFGFTSSVEVIGCCRVTGSFVWFRVAGLVSAHALSEKEDKEKQGATHSMDAGETWTGLDHGYSKTHNSEPQACVPRRQERSQRSVRVARSRKFLPSSI